MAYEKKNALLACTSFPSQFGVFLIVFLRLFCPTTVSQKHSTWGKSLTCPLGCRVVAWGAEPKCCFKVLVKVMSTRNREQPRTQHQSARQKIWHIDPPCHPFPSHVLMHLQHHWGILSWGPWRHSNPTWILQPAMRFLPAKQSQTLHVPVYNKTIQQVFPCIHL